jgi:hypothetical protein
VKGISEALFDNISNMPPALVIQQMHVVSHLLTVNGWSIHLKFSKIAREAIAQSIGTE